MDERTVGGSHNAFGAQHLSEGAGVKSSKRLLDLLLGILVGGFGTEACEHLVGMMMVIVTVIVTAAAVTVLVITVFVVIVVMLVLVLMIAVVVIVVMLVIAVAVIVIVVMLVLAVAVVMIVVMLMLMLMIVMASAGTVSAVGVHHLLQLLLQRVNVFHCAEDLGTVQLIPIGGDDGGGGILFHHQRHGGSQLFVAAFGGVAEDDAACILHLIAEEFTEVLHVHLAFARIHHGGIAVQLCVFKICILDGLDDVGQLAHARGLDENAVGGILLHYLLQRLAEVAHQRAADAARVDLVDGNARIGKKSAVNADLAEFVFDQHQLFAGVGFFDELFDKGRFAGSQKAGEYIDFSHLVSLPDLVLWHFTPHPLL